MYILRLYYELFVKNEVAVFLDKKDIEHPKKFDKKEYNRQYTKNNYKRFNTVIKPELAERINNYCTESGISKAEFLQRAIDIIENRREP